MDFNNITWLLIKKKYMFKFVGRNFKGTLDLNVSVILKWIMFNTFDKKPDLGQLTD